MRFLVTVAALLLLAGVAQGITSRSQGKNRIPRNLRQEIYQRQNKRTCVSTPDEFETAFRSGANRCVATNVLVGGIVGDGVCNVADFPSNFDATKSLLLSFLSGRDGLEKYLALSPIKKIGNFVEGGFEPGVPGFNDPRFEGIADVRNGQAFLENIGFAPAFSDISKVYQLVISFVPPPAVTPCVPPKWLTGLPNYVDFLMKSRIQKSAPLSRQARDILEENNYQELTGCAASCAFLDLEFPNTAEGATTVIKQLDEPLMRDPVSGNCINEDESRYVLTAPNTHNKEFDCNADWLSEYAEFTKFEDDSDAALELLYERLTDGTLSERTKALAFRAFVIQGFVDASQLFTGDGYTANDVGGLFLPTSSEFVVQPQELFTWNSVPGSQRSVSIPICIQPTRNGFFPNDDGTCDADCQ